MGDAFVYFLTYLGFQACGRVNLMESLVEVLPFTSNMRKLRVCSDSWFLREEVSVGV